MSGTLPLPVVGALFAYGAAATLFPPYGWGIRVAMAAPYAVAVAIAVSRGWHRRETATVAARPGAPGGALLVWFVLMGVAVAVQLANYLSQPRHVYPTLSSLTAVVFDAYPVRAAAFGLWLWLGWYLLDR